MSDTQLRSRLVRLAHAHPELRPELLGLLKEAAVTPTSTPEEVGRVIARHIASAVSDRLGYSFTTDYSPEILGFVLDYLSNPSQAKKMLAPIIHRTYSWLSEQR